MKRKIANWEEKYIVTDVTQSHVLEADWMPKYTNEEATRTISLDSEVIDGAFFLDVAWFWPGDWPQFKSEEGTLKPHTHEYDEAIAYLGTSTEDPHDLGGEIELWINGKQNIIDKSFVAFLPAGVEHGPWTIIKIDKPILHFGVGMGKKYL